jgi:hypothetical protein
MQSADDNADEGFNFPDFPGLDEDTPDEGLPLIARVADYAADARDRGDYWQRHATVMHLKSDVCDALLIALDRGLSSHDGLSVLRGLADFFSEGAPY